MADIWTTHHEGDVEGRPVTVQTHPEGGYRVKTTQGADDEGKVFGDESSTVIITPTAAGRPIDIEGETIDEVRDQLKQEEFSEDAIQRIIDQFPT